QARLQSFAILAKRLGIHFLNHRQGRLPRGGPNCPRKPNERYAQSAQDHGPPSVKGGVALWPLEFTRTKSEGLPSRQAPRRTREGPAAAQRKKRSHCGVRACIITVAGLDPAPLARDGLETMRTAYGIGTTMIRTAKLACGLAGILVLVGCDVPSLAPDET